MSRVLPILFSTDMVRAILDGRKTVARFVIKPQPIYSLNAGFSWKGASYGTDLPPTQKGAAYNFRCAAPYQPGDILYVKEPWHVYQKRVGKGETCRIAEFFGYKASIQNSEDADTPWKSPACMPNEAARIWLKVKDVRVERLQDMDCKDAMKEGIDPRLCINLNHTVVKFQKLWNSTIKKSDLDIYGWDANPYVWVIDFERCEKPERW